MARETITTFVVDDLFPWPDEECGANGDGPLERGTIVRGGERLPCTLRKIAPRGATLRANIAGSDGSAIALELDNGQRRNCTIEWARAGELGVRFAEPIDIVALINRNLIAQPAERRRMPRVELRCSVHVKWCERLEASVMRNISCTGMQVEGDALPNAGTLVSLYVEGIVLPAAELVWRQGTLAGFEFFEDLNWSSMIAWVREVSRGRMLN